MLVQISEHPDSTDDDGPAPPRTFGIEELKFLGGYIQSIDRRIVFLSHDLISYDASRGGTDENYNLEKTVNRCPENPLAYLTNGLLELEGRLEILRSGAIAASKYYVSTATLSIAFAAYLVRS